MTGETNFMEKLRNVLHNGTKRTENGAAGYATTGKELVDLNFAVSSLRNMNEAEITGRFIRAFYEDRVLAMKWLFFLRDARGGLGERRSFRIIIRYLSVSMPEMMNNLVDLMAEYGRFDDMLCLLDTPVEEKVIVVLQAQLEADLENMAQGRGISLCAKWMPSGNTSSEESRKSAAKLRRGMGLTAGEYRKMLASLRSYLHVTEVHMSGGRWEEIDYTMVPSKANVLYRRAFLRHDEARRKSYLEQARVGRAVMHADVLMPHDIVSQYAVRNGWGIRVGGEDAALEALWKNLPDTVAEAKNVLCVVDGSGSMLCSVGAGSVTALHVSNALGIYFAERMRGAYHNRFITFSSSPKYVDLSGCRTLREKLELAFCNSDCSNTNMEATFELVLQTAVQNHLEQEELPRTILVISDMEFDNAVHGVNADILFATIRKRFERYGYRLPRLVFWNVNSRTNVIPVRENALGVGLVSGFSVNVCRMVLANELDPFACLKKTLEGERYREVGERLCS
ncbi:MAG: DUF2828 domain-containing protein [Lachnospiraceae bacterium]|nr:DUF2828 domain-containing protein [Lachnospiraceae bacterium]MCM1240553.1 DUF2828 domain-containing protein [Lachnospiraceae bacterium]